MLERVDGANFNSHEEDCHPQVRIKGTAQDGFTRNFGALEGIAQLLRGREAASDKARFADFLSLGERIKVRAT